MCMWGVCTLTQVSTTSIITPVSVLNTFSNCETTMGRLQYSNPDTHSILPFLLETSFSNSKNPVLILWRDTLVHLAPVFIAQITFSPSASWSLVLRCVFPSLLRVGISLALYIFKQTQKSV